MIDAFNTQDIERRFDISRRPFFSGMGHQMQTQFAATGKDAGKFFRRMAALG